MNYPLISEYVESIKLAEDNFAELTALRPVLDADGTPVMSSGNFAVVFKMRDVETGKLYAVRCFHREQAGRAESYKLIAEELRDTSFPYLVSFRYMEGELFVDSEQSQETEFPVLLMDWVEGVTLDKYLREHLADQRSLDLLVYRFSQLAVWLMQQSFAHGDLKPDNILVRADGSLVLVDYDGMFVPAMQGQQARELGSPDFRHPQRTEDDFGERIDDFSIVSMLLSLKLIALHPEYLEEYGASDRLLFSANDYADLSACRLLKDVLPSADAELNRLSALFLLCHSTKNLAHASFMLLEVEKPKAQLSTKVTDEDLANAWTDEYDVIYSKDKKRLLEYPYWSLPNYRILGGTEVICDSAFYNCECLHEIIVPASVTSIGWGAFRDCISLREIFLPASVTLIGDIAFMGCSSLREIIIPDSVASIGWGAFRDCSSLREIIIPQFVTSIGWGAFECCSSLQKITLPASVTFIDSNAFLGCSSLQKIIIPRQTREKFEKLLPEYKDKLVEQ
ncbi:MAG: leucine-rich repeat protein [Prevotella sp.]|nr:leucine-rich repeat protein [Prevotella sp.]